MRYVAAYLLAVLGGTKNPTQADITKILESVGLDVDKDQLSKVFFLTQVSHVYVFVCG